MFIMLHFSTFINIFSTLSDQHFTKFCLSNSNNKACSTIPPQGLEHTNKTPRVRIPTPTHTDTGATPPPITPPAVELIARYDGFLFICTKHFPLHLPVPSAQVVAREGHTSSTNVRKCFPMFKKCSFNVQLKVLRNVW